jgi:threonyl-tRNA synthetase
MGHISQTASIKLLFSIYKLLPAAKIKAVAVRDHIFSVDLDLTVLPPEETVKLLETEMSSIDSIEFREMMSANAAALFEHHGQPDLAEKYRENPSDLVCVAQYKNFYAPSSVDEIEDGVYKLIDFSLTEQGSRLTGLAASDKQKLKKAFKRYEAGKDISHQRLGDVQELFFFDDQYAGCCFLTPKGSIVYDCLVQFWHGLNSPHATKSPIDPAVAHSLLFRKLEPQASDLPLTLAELHQAETLNNDFKSLFKLAKFTQDTTHIFTTQEQAVKELTSSLLFMNKTFMMLDFEVQWHLTADSHPPTGTRTSWKQGVQMLQDALQAANIEWEPRSLDHDTHGPAAYITIPDAIGQRWEVGVLALNLATPTNQHLQYLGMDKQMHTPIMIMRSLFFSVERIMALQLENKNGLLPTWLAPEQVRILPIAERHHPKAQAILDRLQTAGVRAHIDLTTDPLGAKIHAAETAKVPWIIVIGEQEVQNDSIAVRRCGDPQPRVGVKWDAFISDIVAEIKPPATEKIRSEQETKG